MYEKPQYLTRKGYTRDTAAGESNSLRKQILRRLADKKKVSPRKHTTPSGIHTSTRKNKLSEEGAKLIAEAIRSMLRQ